VAAFKRHWAPDDATPVLSVDQRALLQCLTGKQQSAGSSINH
jgi:hypothetical protein